MFTFARYAIESVFRNRRRSLSAVVGVVVAMALVSGSFIAVDSSALGRLRAALEEVEVDFTAESYYYEETAVDPDELAGMCEAAEDVNDIEDAEVLTVVHGWMVMNEEGEYTYDWHGASAAFLSEDWTRMRDVWAIEGELPPQGTVAVSEGIADALEISPGENITCSYSVYNGYEYVNGTYVEKWITVNISMEVSSIWSQGNYRDQDYYHDPETISIRGYPVQIVFNLADGPSVMEQLSDAGAQPYVDKHILVWIDREAVVEVSDIGGTVDRLRFIQNRLNYRLSSYNVYFQESGLLYALLQVNSDISGMKFLFFGLSLPVVGLGAYLSLVGVDLGVSARRREVGILKSRGASNRQVFISLLVESITLGCIAGLLGLLSGVLISRFLIDSAVTIATSSTSSSASLTDISIGASTVIASMVLGVLMMVVSAYRPLKRASKVDAAEALHYYVRKETQLRYRARWDITALVLVVLSVFSVLTSRDPFMYGRSFMLSIILGIMWLIGIAMLPVMPFLLSASIIRLLTRGTRKLYSKFTRLVRFWTKDLHYLVEKNIVRNPKRASNMCIIIALALAFGLFISITMETTIGRQIDSIRSEIGADIRTNGYATWNGTSGGLNLSLMDTVDSIDGVAGSTRYYTFSFEPENWGVYWGYAMVLDPVAYCDVVGLGGWFDGGDRDRIELLQENGTALLSSQYAEDNYLLVGDYITVEYAGVATFELEIVGTVGDLPGLNDGVFFSIGTAHFVEEAALASNSFVLLVDAEKGANQSAIADEVESICREAGAEGTYTEVFDERVAEIENDPAYGALSDFLYMEYALSFVIMCVGVGLVIFVTVSERERELACIMARGSSSSQMRKVLMGESLSLMSLGFIVGTGVGIFSAALFDAMIQINGDGHYGSFIMLGWVTWSILVASLVSFLLASLLATYRVGKLRLAEVLRIRGG